MAITANLTTTVRNVSGRTLTFGTTVVVVAAPIPSGHKIALVAIAIIVDSLPTDGCPCYGCSQRRRASRRVK